MKNIFKKFAQAAVVAVAAFAVNAYAILPGAYVGGSLGWGNLSDQADISTDGIAGRLFAGYQFDKTLGLELGWDKFSDVTARFYGSKLRVETYAIDLTAKAAIEIANGFGAYAKLGAAYINEDARLSGFYHSSDSTDAVLPTFGVGFTYDISPNVVADLSWNRIQKVGNTNIDSTDMVGLGLSYYFG